MIELMLTKFQLFFIVLARIFGMMAIAPFYSSFSIPFRVKGILALLSCIAMYPMISQAGIPLPGDWIDFGLLVMNEAMIGLTIGFIISIIMVIFHLSGQIFSMQMGLGISNVFDPMSQMDVSIIGQFQSLFGSLIFIAVGGPQILLSTIYESYLRLPVLNLVQSSKPLAGLMIQVFSDMFEISLQFAFPVMVTILIVTVCMGLLAKFAPQMNILMLGFPIYLIVGFLTMLIIMPAVISQGQDIIMHYLRYLNELF